MSEDLWEEPLGHYIYLYRNSPSSPVQYVGYGASPDRAMSHRDGSHNAKLHTWLQKRTYSLEIAGPYHSKDEAFHVEAALISALKPTFNASPGTGPKFAPLGVPPELADRATKPALTLSDVGRQARGAVIVLLKGGSVTNDGRKRSDPANPEVETIATHVEGWWEVERHMARWRSDPGAVPQVLVGAFGPPKNRFIIGAFKIDTQALGAHPDRDRDGAIWRFPLAEREDADAAELRGRKLDGVLFGQGRWANYWWVNENGQPHR